MKKIFISLFLLIMFSCLSGCKINNNTKKPSLEMLYSDWYNCSILPSMDDPFVEVYDGCYSIDIDENNNVTFKSIDQEELTGTLEYKENEYSISIQITFSNNKISNGRLTIRDDSPYLFFYYNGVNHCFTKSKMMSKEEFELYRNNFNEFLRESYINNSYPSNEEVENNELYKQYTNFVHIDPCCNGPKMFVGVKKIHVTYDDETGQVTVKYDDGRIENLQLYDIDKIVLVKLDGTFELLDQVQDGECFLTNQIENGQYYASNSPSLFYFECNHQWDEGFVDTTSTILPPSIKFTCTLCGTTKIESSELLDHTHNYIEGLCDCGEFDINWLNENFRLSDEQFLFSGNTELEFLCDVILLTLKHTTTYIELSKRHFGIDAITKVVYISATPPSHFYEPRNEEKLDNYSQIVFLYVDVETKEEIIKLIKEIEKLPFVRSAEPNYIGEWE